MRPKFKINEWKAFSVKLLAVDAVLWILVIISSTQIEEVSRRMVYINLNTT